MPHLAHVLTLGDPLSSDLDLGSNKTFDHVIAVESKQEGNLLSLCSKHIIIESHICISEYTALIQIFNYSELLLLHYCSCCYLKPTDYARLSSINANRYRPKNGDVLRLGR